MNYFEIIELNRVKHGYLSKSLKTYKKFCNKQIRENQGSAIATINKLESNLTKFQIFNSKKFLKKNFKILDSDLFSDQLDFHSFKDAYRSYCRIFTEPFSLEELVNLRNYLCDYHTFLSDMYAINDDRFDLYKYRLSHLWNDITLQFESQAHLDNFRNGNFNLTDNRFNTQLALRAAKFDRAMSEFINVLINSSMNNGDSKNGSNILSVFEKAKKLFKISKDLNSYLSDNFVDSDFVRKSALEIEKMYGFVCNQTKYENYDGGHLFASYKSHLKNLKEKHSISSVSLRKMLVDKLVERIRIDDSQKKRHMPFLPTTYDIAYDYIQYPKEENK